MEGYHEVDWKGTWDDAREVFEENFGTEGPSKYTFDMLAQMEPASRRAAWLTLKRDFLFTQIDHLKRTRDELSEHPQPGRGLLAHVHRNNNGKRARTIAHKLEAAHDECWDDLQELTFLQRRKVLRALSKKNEQCK